MKNGQFYFIHHCPIQNSKYNITAESREIQFQNLLSGFKKTIHIVGCTTFYLKWCLSLCPTLTLAVHQLQLNLSNSS